MAHSLCLHHGSHLGVQCEGPAERPVLAAHAEHVPVLAGLRRQHAALPHRAQRIGGHPFWIVFRWLQQRLRHCCSVLAVVHGHHHERRVQVRRRHHQVPRQFRASVHPAHLRQHALRLQPQHHLGGRGRCCDVGDLHVLRRGPACGQGAEGGPGCSRDPCRRGECTPHRKGCPSVEKPRAVGAQVEKDESIWRWAHNGDGHGWCWRLRSVILRLRTPTLFFYLTNFTETVPSCYDTQRKFKFTRQRSVRHMYANLWMSARKA
mmetsp:Transcript_16812/g.31860  ORF Transcript_16812/g.31860 Transcript_16812/m.31860 type:complete len:262 (+) Transcript_16812:845-1630(+)